MLFSIYSIFIDPLLRGLRNHIIELAEIKAGTSGLDLGCGTGEQVFCFTRRKAAVIGIDRNPKMINVASTLKANYNLPEASFQMASAMNLPFKDGVFDFASASLMLHEKNSEDRYSIIQEMCRVVKKNGMLLFMDFRVPLPKNVPGLFIRSIEFIAGKDNYRCFRDYLQHMGLEALLRGNGLSPWLKTIYISGNILIILTKNNKYTASQPS